MNKHLLIALSVFLMADLGAPLLAQEAGRRPIQIDDYFALKNVGSPKVSPDGDWVAYTFEARISRTTARKHVSG